MSAPIVVFCIGNPSRGDDALGPACARRLEAWIAEQDLAESIEVIEDFQLNIEHALDLQGRTAAIFVDAGAATAGAQRAFDFYRIGPVDRRTHSTHALPPESVLHVLSRLPEMPAPPRLDTVHSRGRIRVGGSAQPKSRRPPDGGLLVSDGAGAVCGARDLVGLPPGRCSAINQDRNLGMGEDLVGLAAQQQAADPAASVGGHENQVATGVFGRFDDGFVGNVAGG